MKYLFLFICLFSTMVAAAQRGKVVPPRAEDKVYTFVEQMPKAKYNSDEYIRQNINYPDAARKDGISGRVIVQFVVRKEGNITNVKILRSLGDGCDEETLRVIGNMPPWDPGRQNGAAVDVLCTLPVIFGPE